MWNFSTSSIPALTTMSAIGVRKTGAGRCWKGKRIQLAGTGEMMIGYIERCSTFCRWRVSRVGRYTCASPKRALTLAGAGSGCRRKPSFIGRRFTGLTGGSRRTPGGDATPEKYHGNFDFNRWFPMPVGANPAGNSRWGVAELVGNGWELTDTEFAPLPGFSPYMKSYPDYSQDFFDGKHFVLKGRVVGDRYGFATLELSQLVPSSLSLCLCKVSLRVSLILAALGDA